MPRVLIVTAFASLAAGLVIADPVAATPIKAVTALKGPAAATELAQYSYFDDRYYDDPYRPRRIYPPSYYYGPPRPYEPRAFRDYAPRVYDYTPPAYFEESARPTSCGQYRYWNGEYCADARYERPYLGPKW